MEPKVGKTLQRRAGFLRSTSAHAGPPANAGEDWDDALIAVARNKDRDAFARLFLHFAPRIKRFLMRSGSPPPQAEELAQEALATVWNKARLFDPARANAGTWVFAIARNLRVDSLRRRQGVMAGDDAVDFDLMEADQCSAEERLEQDRLCGKLRDALYRLRPEQRQVLQLSYYENEPHSRIAAELGMPLGTVKTHIHRAVAQLRQLMGK